MPPVHGLKQWFKRRRLGLALGLGWFVVCLVVTVFFWDWGGLLFIGSIVLAAVGRKDEDPPRLEHRTYFRDRDLP